jgi:hypothetical protein
LSPSAMRSSTVNSKGLKACVGAEPVP